MATQEQLRHPERFGGYLVKTKENLIQFIDEAIEYGHTLPSKRGRKTRLTEDKEYEEEHPIESVDGDNRVKIPLPNNWKGLEEEGDRDVSSKHLEEEQKKIIKTYPPLPEILAKPNDPLVWAYPVPVPVPMHSLYGMYNFMPSLAYQPYPLRLSIPNKQYY